MKQISRRTFITTASKGLAGAGIVAGCNQRILVAQRPPSAPIVIGAVFDDTEHKKVLISWKKHDQSDITGDFSDIQIVGYNIYKSEHEHEDGEKINEAVVSSCQYTDKDDLDYGKTYYYRVSAVGEKKLDQSLIEGPLSKNVTCVIEPPSPIYRITNENVNSGKTIDAAVVTAMIHAGVKAFTGKPAVDQAYESLFPSLTDETIIAIKINCLGRSGLSSHPEVVHGIIDGLKQMNNGTFNPYNIIVFDDRPEGFMKSAGFTLKDSPGDYRCVTTIGNWSDTLHTFTGNKKTSSQHFSKIVEEADYIINVPVVKDHSNAGITFSLKNFYGVVDKPGDMHDDMCDPFVSEVYRVYKDKVVLIVGDAVFAAHKGGPNVSGGWTFNPKSIYIGTDPVAMDNYVLFIVNKKRLSENMSKIETNPANKENPNDYDARHIRTAAQSPYNFGKFGYKIIEVSL